MTQEEFKKLFDTYFDLVRNYVYYRSGDENLATDIAQETFMKIWEKKLKPDHKKEKGLLFKIAGDLFVSRYRKKQLELKFASNHREEYESDTPEEMLQYSELSEKYEKALKELDDKKRVVFLMSRNDGLSYKEIAQHLEISVKAVEKRMNKALNHLKIKLQ